MRNVDPSPARAGKESLAEDEAINGDNNVAPTLGSPAICIRIVGYLLHEQNQPGDYWSGQSCHAHSGKVWVSQTSCVVI